MSFNRKYEEGVAVDLVDCGFPADVGEGGVKLAIPLVSAIEYVYLNQRAFVDAYQLVAGFEFDIFALGGNAYRGLDSLFQIIGGQLDFHYFGSIRLVGSTPDSCAGASAVGSTSVTGAFNSSASSASRASSTSCHRGAVLGYSPRT